MANFRECIDWRVARKRLPSSGSLSKEELEQYAAYLCGRGRNRPEVVVVDSPKDLPFDAPKNAQGVIYRGTMYLISEKIASPEELREVISHEMWGHFGLHGFFGDNLNNAIFNIHLANPLIREYAKEWQKAIEMFKRCSIWTSRSIISEQ